MMIVVFVAKRLVMMMMGWVNWLAATSGLLMRMQREQLLFFTASH